MTLSFDQATDLLRRTPGVLTALLFKLDPAWLEAREHEGGWTVREILAHVTYGDAKDWMNRVEIILNEGEATPFESYDPAASRDVVGSPNIENLLDRFQTLRADNLVRLEALGITGPDLEKTGIHPELGTVTLRQLIAAWAGHDLSHIAQISRILARHMAEDVGPWTELYPVMKGPL